MISSRIRTTVRAASLASALLLAGQAVAAPWSPRDKAARAKLNLAAETAERGDFVEGARLALESSALSPSTGAHWIAGQSLAWAGEWRAALEQYDLALADPDLPHARRQQIEPRRQLARAFIDADDLRAAGRWIDARTAYAAILGTATPDDTDRARASEALAQVEQEEAAATQPHGDVDATVPKSESSTPAPVPAPTVERTEPATLKLPSHVVRASRWEDTAALVAAGVGLTAIGGGAWLYAHGGALDDRSAASTTPEGDRADLRDRATTYRGAGTLVVAAGGTLLIAGLIKLAIAPDSHALATVSAANGGAAFALGGRF